MTGRKKKGVGYFVSGAVFIVVGFIFSAMDVNPAWLNSAVVLVGMIAEFFGFKAVFPDTE